MSNEVPQLTASKRMVAGETTDSNSPCIFIIIILHFSMELQDTDLRHQIGIFYLRHTMLGIPFRQYLMFTF